MINVNVNHSLDKLAASVGLMKRDLPFITSRALNGTGLLAKDKLKIEISRRINQPTAYTRNIMWFKYSTKAKLEAQVKLKDVMMSGSRMTPAQRLGHLFSTGGARNYTGFEGWLLRAGLLKSGEYIVPTTHAKKDSNGNVSKGLLVQVMSQLKLGGDMYSFKSNSSRSKRNRKKNRIFWSNGDARTESFSRGIWAETPRGIVKLFSPAKRPSYRVLVNMAEISSDVVKRNFERIFIKEALIVIGKYKR